MQSRSEQRSRQRRNRIISISILVLVVVLSPWWSREAAQIFSRKLMGSGDHFRVNHVVVTGIRVVPEQTILKLANIPVRQMMFNLQFRDVEKRIQKNPWVKSARVQRRLPDTVELQITERIPVAAVRGEKMMVLTADSLAITPPPENWVWDLPILSPPRSVRLESGSRVKDEAVLTLLQQTARARMVSPEIWKNISELYYSRNQIRAVLDQPRAELIAGKGVTELAWVGLQKYFSEAEPDSTGTLTRIDLRIPGKLVVSKEPENSTENDAG